VLREYEDDLEAVASGVGKGIAGESYFKPGPMTLLPIRRLVIERQVQPEILEFVEMEEVLVLFKMCVIVHLVVPISLPSALFGEAKVGGARGQEGGRKRAGRVRLMTLMLTIELLDSSTT
jgi:hypothetical protein